jgi:exodeoxyribonuclease VII large subunit
MPDDIPTLADLRRKRTPPPRTPSLFDNQVTQADILAEQSRSLNTPSQPFQAPSRNPSPPPQDAAPPVAQQVLTVAELVRRVRSLVERSHGHVTVEGEISNWRPAASGHAYFTLKDGEAQLSIVLFRRQGQLLRFRPQDGDAVRISGQLSVYESRGQLQLIAETMQPTGIGALLATVQALKEKLRREGIFANQRPLPAFPRCIGIVTSLQGAALRDIVKVCRRRHASVNLLIYPAAVQGPNCAREVAAGIRWFSSRATDWHLASAQLASSHQSPHHKSPRGVVDVILVARGGGSWEDLHGFDDELVCRAIHASSIPVLTGIGHATDSVLADSAADLCAPTPSAAAELVTAAQYNIESRLDRLHQRLLRGSRYELLRARQRLSGLSAESILARARNTLERRAQHLDDLNYRAETSLKRSLRIHANRLLHVDRRLSRHQPNLRLADLRHRLAALHQRLTAARVPQDAKFRLAHLTTKLETLSPLKVLNRGYALIYTADGSLLRDPSVAPPETTIDILLAAGRLRAKVTAAK